MSWITRVNWIKVAWITWPLVGIAYGIWWWPETEAGQEQARQTAVKQFADDACAVVTATADTGQQRLDAAISCQKFKDAARRQPPVDAPK